MTLEIAKFILASSGNFHGEEIETRIVQAEFTQPEDKQEIQQWKLSGFDSNPSEGVQGLVVDLGSGYRISIAEKDGLTDSSLKPGERQIYSDDGSQIAARLKLNIDGSISVKNEVESVDYGATMTALVDAIKNIATFGSPTSHILTGSSKTALDEALVDVLKVFKGV